MHKILSRWAAVAVMSAAVGFCAHAMAEAPRVPDKISWQMTIEPVLGPTIVAPDDYRRQPLFAVDSTAGIFAVVQVTDAQRAQVAPVGTHISLDGKIVWQRPMPELLGHVVQTARFINGGRLVVYGELPDGKRIRARPNDPMPVGRFVVLSPAGVVERIIPIYRASPATHNARVLEADDDHYEIRLAPTRDGGFVAVGGFGGGPYGWWMARYDAAGKQIWQRGDGRLLLTQIDDAQHWADGRLAVLWVQGALSEQVPASAHLRILNPQGFTAQRYALSRNRSACYRFAGEKTVVIGDDDRIVWADFTGKQARSVAVPADPCPLETAPDGTVVWHNYPRTTAGETLPSRVGGVRPGDTQAWQIDMPDVAEVQPLLGGSFIALLLNAKPSDAIVLRRYD